MFKKLFDSGYKELKRCEKIAKQVFSYEERQFWFLHSFVTSISSFGIFYAGNTHSCV